MAVSAPMLRSLASPLVVVEAAVPGVDITEWANAGEESEVSVETGVRGSAP